jgi:predicted dehydrogenase
MQIEFELVGSKGALHFNQERFNELRLYQSAGAGGGEPVVGPDFREGWEVQKVVDAILRSAREREWVKVG